MIPKSVLNNIAIQVQQMLEDQIERGVDIEGNKFKYSDKPFVRPYDKRLKSFQKDEGKVSLFTTKSGSLWMLIHGGYKSYREMTGRDPDGDFLQDTGAMLGALSVKSEASNNTASLKWFFTDPVQAQKAYWLNVTGVGKSKSKWLFMGLTKENRGKLEKYIKVHFKEHYGRIAVKTLQV